MIYCVITQWWTQDVRGARAKKIEKGPQHTLTTSKTESHFRFLLPSPFPGDPLPLRTELPGGSGRYLPSRTSDVIISHRDCSCVIITSAICLTEIEKHGRSQFVDNLAHQSRKKQHFFTTIGPLEGTLSCLIHHRGMHK